MHRRDRARLLVFCLSVICPLLNLDKSWADEVKSYPVLSGVGMALKVEGEDLLVAVIVPNSPADKSGKIKKGDLLLSIETGGKRTSLKGKSVGEGASLIRGPVGTSLTLEIVRPADGTKFSVKLERAPLEIEGHPSSYEPFIGKPVADLKLSSIDAKSTKQLSDFRGKVVLLDFWASWCPTCYQPVTKLQRLAADHPEWAGKVELIAVTVDAEIAKAAETIRQKNWDKTEHFSVDFDALKEIGVSSVPVAIVISKDGKVTNMAGSHALDFEKEIRSQLMAE